MYNKYDKAIVAYINFTTVTNLYVILPDTWICFSSGAPNENIVQNHLNIELLNVF